MLSQYNKKKTNLVEKTKAKWQVKSQKEIQGINIEKGVRNEYNQAN